MDRSVWQSVFYLKHAMSNLNSDIALYFSLSKHQLIALDDEHEMIFSM